MKSKSDKVKILQVFGGLNIGGAETMLMNLYRNLDKDKFQFDFIVHSNEKQYFEDEIKKLGGNIYVVPKYKGYNHFAYKRAWNNFFAEHKEYKIIHSHVRSTASIYLKIAKKYGLVTISHSHNTSNGIGFSSLIKKIFQYRIRHISDYFIGCSKKSAVWLFGKKIANSDRCFILNNAIDTKKFCFNEKIREKIRKEYNLDNKLVICQVGRFADVKNHEFTLELFEKYLKTNDNSILLLIGNGPLEEKIKNKIKNLNIESNVIILKNRNDIYDLLQGADIFIMPSLYEGLPLTLVEAQTSSLPCIVSNKISDGFLIDELINKVDLNSSYDEWVKVINKNKNNIRKNRQKEIIESGFDIEKNVEWLEKFYLKILRK